MEGRGRLGKATKDYGRLWKAMEGRRGFESLEGNGEKFFTPLGRTCEGEWEAAVVSTYMQEG